MKRKIPPEAFAIYLAMGPGRSYLAVATQIGVSKKAVQLCAEREGWQQKLAEEEKKTRQAAERQAAHDLKARSEQHLKVTRFVQGKAIEKIKSGDFETVMNAVKAYSLMVDKERLLLGEPTEATAFDIEKKIREEHERWLVPVDPEPSPTAQVAGEPQPDPQRPIETPPPPEDARDDDEQPASP